MEDRDYLQFDIGLRYHLQDNHYPSIPLSFMDACKQAIECGTRWEWDEDWDELIELPEGVLYTGKDRPYVEGEAFDPNGSHFIRASKLIEFAHLDYFVDMLREMEMLCED